MYLIWQMYPKSKETATKQVQRGIDHYKSVIGKAPDVILAPPKWVGICGAKKGPLGETASVVYIGSEYVTEKSFRS